MDLTIRDDLGRPGSEQTRRGLMEMIRKARSILLVTVVLAYSAGASAQEGKGKEFRASVLDPSANYQRITVPINRSVTVETTVEAARADVVTRQIADVQVVSPTRMLITGNSFGTTTVVLSGAENKEYVFEVAVELDLTQLNDAIREIDPQSDARATSVRGNILLIGTVSSAERARRIVELADLFMPLPVQGAPTTRVQNHMEVAGEQQVLLRCVIAEVSRAAARELGINGFLAGENFRDAFLVNQIGGINSINIGAAAGAPVTQNLPFLTDENGISLTRNPTLSLGFPRVQTQLFIKALADNQLLTVLAEPNLVAISGETASFLAGGEFPIPVPQGLNQSITIEFRKFGVGLNFTPVVRGHQLIRLRVAPEVSELDFTTAVQIQGFVVPGLTTRATETTVELGSGQTIAIAGLLNEQMRGLSSQVPGIGDVPVLGALFRSINYRRSLTELVVLVTPEIVAPLDAHQKPRLPGQDVVAPNDFQLYGLGLVEAPSDNRCGGRPCRGVWNSEGAIPSEPDEVSLHGPWGHAGEEEAR